MGGDISMTWIRRAVVSGAAFYVLLMAAEVFLHPESLFGAVTGCILLGLLASVFLMTREHRLHRGEMILLWVMIFLFVLYAGVRV
jgi:hypothetical protein